MLTGAFFKLVCSFGAARSVVGYCAAGFQCPSNAIKGFYPEGVPVQCVPIADVEIVAT